LLASHGRFAYSPITRRPDFSWPGEKRLAIYVALCVEHFSYGEGGLGISYSPGLPHPNTYNWAWREWGNRVGAWRLLELFEQLGVTPAVLLNAECYEHCPELVAAYRAAGAEFVAHGRTNSTHPNELDERAERELIRSVYDTMSRHEGVAPAGWMSPGANPSAVTEDLLAETGFRYTLDWPMDDQPVWLETRDGPLLSIPYPHEANDVPTVVLHHATSPAFADLILTNVHEMVEQSRRQPLVCGITIHTFIVGQPFRLRQFRDALSEIVGLPAVWMTTPSRIADHFAEIQPPPAPGS
jgi:allantoinase